MSCKTGFQTPALFLFAFNTLSSSTVFGHEPPKDRVEEVVVWGQKQDTRSAAPQTQLTPEDLVSVNIATTEDIVKYEPGLVIRRRYIGDANGTLGMRGSNMFQTARSMVFADGIPLHYFLQTRWNGAPRWTMVSASEIAQVDVLYGPYSAEYSGNAMGGAVIIETAIPQEREFHMDGTFFSQSFDDYGFDDSVNGYKGFMSYGDKIGDLSLYASYNRLRNDSQPMSFYYGGSSSAVSPTPVSGAISGTDERSNPQLYFGDSGVAQESTDNLKFKLGYDLNDAWSMLLNVAFEDRYSKADPDSYVRDSAGNKVWSGNVTQDGQTFSMPASRLSVSEMDRHSLSTGLRVRGDLSDSVNLELAMNRFDILENETRTSAVNPRDASYNGSGQVAEYDDTGWKTADVKLSFDDLGISGLKLATGLRHEAYEMNYSVYDSNNYKAGRKTAFKNGSGGKTELSAMFVEAIYDLGTQWKVILGNRFESWKSSDGYYTSTSVNEVPGKGKTNSSPKLSIGYQPGDSWSFRYSLARSYRFPIVEELFSQYQAYNAASTANPGLDPEAGIHHNLMIERALDQGYLRINLFAENVRDVIDAQSTTLPGGGSLSTFIPVDEVQTRGAEFILNATNWPLNRVDTRFNLVRTDSEIIENKADPALEGNVYPRMPEWRSNLVTTWHLNARLDIGGSVQYASDSYGRLDNSDNEENVYGAQDGYLRFSLKSSYAINTQTKASIGIDNLTNEINYVAHPWPGRTLYFSVAYDL